MPPMKFMVNFDIVKDQENLYYKAKSVMEALTKTGIRIGAIRERKAIGEMSYAVRCTALEAALKEVVRVFNVKEREQKGENWEEYRPKKLVSLAFTTVYNLIPSTKQPSKKK